MGGSKPRINYKDKFIEAWLNLSCSSRSSRSTSTERLGELALVAAEDIHRPLDSSRASTTFSSLSKKSDKSVTLYDPEFRKALSYRNVYINHTEPPIGLLRRAEEIISRLRSSSE